VTSRPFSHITATRATFQPVRTLRSRDETKIGYLSLGKAPSGLLDQNLLKWRDITRLDSTYEHYREIAGGVLLMYGGKSDSKPVTRQGAARSDTRAL
jgi:hypothetical protein